MEKIKVSEGIYWVSIPEVDLRILCGCPADSVKHLMVRGLILQKEKDNVVFETGPNAILLSDISMQKGSFSNLAEFPVLQMFYRQGMLIPNHPNNTGLKPMLIGLEEQVNAQSKYIRIGNYGLTSQEEIQAAGVDEEQANEIMRMKLWFAFGKFKKPEELLDLKIIDKDAIHLKDGVFVHRRGFNQYEILYKGESVMVDLNLAEDEEYRTPYTLDFHNVKREYFSIIHIGEGDGWDISRPCMGSIVCFQGKIYLIDAGPGILHSLTSLGIGVNELEGIFQTHLHDDHFAGLTNLVFSDHKIKYYATSLVKHSVAKKLSALLTMEEKDFESIFDVRELTFDTWNNISGLEVMPVLSPHPVETSILYFRTLWKEKYRTYAHLADIASFDVLDRMTTDEPGKNGLSPEINKRTKKLYKKRTNIKKLDIGGGLIHGKAEDFIDDRSGKILLSHIATHLTDAQKEIGSNATFGMQDVLIASNRDYGVASAVKYLQSYFPTAPRYALEILLNCPIVSFNPGTIVLKKGETNAHIYLIVAGVVEFLESNSRVHNMLSAGALMGELAGLSGMPVNATYRAVCYVKALEIPNDLYLSFINRFEIFDKIKLLLENRQFLQNTRIFGEMVSCLVQNQIARHMRPLVFKTGQIKPSGTDTVEGKGPQIYIIKNGEIQLQAKKQLIESLGPGSYLGDELVFFRTPGIFKLLVTQPTELFCVPRQATDNIPIVRWKLKEAFDNRMRRMRSHFPLEWRKEYSIQVGYIDNQHKKLFRKVGELCNYLESVDIEAINKNEGKKNIKNRVAETLEHIKKHFSSEEAYMEKNNYPELEQQKQSHGWLIKEIGSFLKDLEKEREFSESEMINLLREWLLRHMLAEDIKYKDFFTEKASNQ